MKQTAVEWFFEQLTEVDYGCINKTFLQINNSLAGHKLRELFEQAKAMEKEQKIEFAFDFYYDFSNKLGVPFNLISENRLNAEQYYIKTFKSE